MEMSADGLTRLVEREGMRRVAYKDIAGVWTICAGHTSSAGPPKVERGMTKTLEQCRAILKADVKKFEKCVDEAIDKPMKQHEFDAMVSLAYNIGCAAFKRSTVAREFNKGDKEKAANAFRMWNKAGGHIIKGLINRRESERNQFLGKPLG